MSRLIPVITVAVAVFALYATASGGGACDPAVQYCPPAGVHAGYAPDLLGPGFLLPTEWHKLEPTCGSNYGTQSPIDISSVVSAGGGHRRNVHTSSGPGGLTVVAPHHYKPIVFSGHTALTNTEFLNNGHAMQVNMKANTPTVTGGAMESKYNVLQLHFHWGKESTTGSEHTLDGNQLPLEMHIVTANSEYSGSHAYETKGLAVVGCFFKIGNENAELKKLLDNIGPGNGKVLLNGSKVTLSSTLDISKLLPPGESYYSYDGGLTTPPCTQTVVWHVMKAQAEVSEAQMGIIRTLMMNHTSPIGQNYRPTQSRSGRTVKYFAGGSGHHAAEKCDDPFMIPFITALLLFVIVAGISAWLWRNPAHPADDGKDTKSATIPGDTPGTIG